MAKQYILHLSFPVVLWYKVVLANVNLAVMNVDLVAVILGQKLSSNIFAHKERVWRRAQTQRLSALTIGALYGCLYTCCWSTLLGEQHL